MNMTKMIIKKRTILFVFILVFLAILAGNTFIRQVNRQPKMETFQLKEGGWGYQIKLKGKIIIYQPNIPTYEETTPFPNEKKAQAVGQLVLQKIKEKKPFTVSGEEVDRIMKE